MTNTQSIIYIVKFVTAQAGGSKRQMRQGRAPKARESRRREGWEVGRGVPRAPSPEKFWISDIKMVSCCAFWVVLFTV